ncbi:MAG: hypothetical protein MJ154_01680 [Candidatus Saccharibacteria bacterium]|nr:hypothetical protein [Candidatus Saccharibacteria bacterium]
MGDDQKPVNGNQPNQIPNGYSDNANVSVEMYAEPTNIIPDTLGSNPTMTGASRITMEQEAAARAAHEAALKAAEKKTHPMMAVGIICAIIAIVVISTIVFISLTRKNDSASDGNANGGSSNVQNDEPDYETQKVGSEEHGYVLIPKEWNPTNVNSGDGSISYSNTDGKSTVYINSFDENNYRTAKRLAEDCYDEAMKIKGSEATMTEETLNDETLYKVHYYVPTKNEWRFEYIFRTYDERVHFIKVTTPDVAASFVDAIPHSWTTTKAKPEPEQPEEPEEEEEETEEESEESSENE